ILWALRRSEPYALDFVGSDEALTPFWRNSASDALRLARIFRLAARSLEKQLPMERRLVRKARAAEQATLTPEEKSEQPDPDHAPPANLQPAALPIPCGLGFRALDSPAGLGLRIPPALPVIASRNGGVGACLVDRFPPKGVLPQKLALGKTGPRRSPHPPDVGTTSGMIRSVRACGVRPLAA
ncbi:hypothetical protein BO068_005167, partial [Escherichia coli]|nr:hypothetical protein [Escherichia coli]